MLTEQQKALVRFGVELLPDRQRDVIRGRFWDEKTLAVVGCELGITRERVRQIEAKALEALRWWLEPLFEGSELVTLRRRQRAQDVLPLSAFTAANA